jgi:ABC-type molybdate transport system ATPase subunit
VVAAVQADPHHGSQVLVRLDCTNATGHSALLSRITARAAHELSLAPGVAAWAQVKAAALVQ